MIGDVSDHGEETGGSLQDVSGKMRCYFDILKCLTVDHDGVEVEDVDSAVADVRRAIAELRVDARQNADENPELQADFQSDLFLLMRASDIGYVCIIPLNDDIAAN